jgi:putative Mn2+ efflux pump MntP
MSLATLLLVAVGLSTDAFGASVGRAVLLGDRARFAVLIQASSIFGLFATLAPILGWILGNTFSGLIEDYDHWVAFTLLSVVGTKMIWDSFDLGEPPSIVMGYRVAVVLIAAIATNIDALAVGVTLPPFHVNLLLAAVLIGGTTFVASLVGGVVGRFAGTVVGRRAEIIGGALLILIGAKIVVEHTLFAPRL